MVQFANALDRIIRAFYKRNDQDLQDENDFHNYVLNKDIF